MELGMFFLAGIGGLTLIVGVFFFVAMVFSTASQLEKLRDRVENLSNWNNRDFGEIYQEVRELKDRLDAPAKPRKR